MALVSLCEAWTKHRAELPKCSGKLSYDPSLSIKKVLSSPDVTQVGARVGSISINEDRWQVVKNFYPVDIYNGFNCQALFSNLWRKVEPVDV